MGTRCMKFVSSTKMSVMGERTNTYQDGSLDLEFSIKWNRFILRFLGICPTSNSRRPLHINFLIAMFNILCLTVPQITYFIMVWGQLDLMIETLTKAIALTTTTLLKMIICNSGKIQSSLSEVLFFMMYMTFSLLQLFIYCYIGEKLNIESVKLSDAAYQCEWYKLNVQEARDLILVMLRAKSPLKITAGKFCSFSLSMFTDVVKTSMGYLSVLLSIKN